MGSVRADIRCSLRGSSPSEPDAAKFCGCSKDTIRRRIKAGDGPPVIRLSSHRIGYRVRDLRAWLDANTEARS
jgi:predicted DNA-binding transcriptional regulator AlpA